MKGSMIALIFIIIFISGCTSTPQTGTSQTETVKIENAQYQDGKLLLTLYTGQSITNTSIKIIGEQGQNLCTKYKELSVGANHFEFTDCELENLIKVSVTPSGGTPSEKDFDLGLPTFDMQEGFRYDYSIITCAGCYPDNVSMYVTEEAQDRWEGVAGIKKSGQMAYVMRYKISKNDMSLLATDPLNASQLVQTNVDYKNIEVSSTDSSYSLYPFYLSVFKEQGLNLDELLQNKNTAFSQQSLNLKIEGKETKDGFLVYKIVITQMQSGQVLGAVYAATEKPYLVIEIEAKDGGFSFKGSERKDFSINDYSGYTLEEIHRPVLDPHITQEPPRE